MTAIAVPIAPAARLTYADYMAEGEVNKRYDIIDGERIFMPNPTPLHQVVTFNIAETLRVYQRSSKVGRMFIAPRDVRISFNPLRTRQPDVLFISHVRMGGQSLSDPTPFVDAPEIVVEVLSDSDTRATRMGKIIDFCAVGVNECWLVGPETETVEVLRLSQDGPERAALYGAGQTLQSLTFPDLIIALDDIFRIED